jgi:hypothetical protein
MGWNNAEEDKRKRTKILDGIFPEIKKAREIQYSPSIQCDCKDIDRLHAEWLEKEKRTWYKATKDCTSIYLIRNPSIGQLFKIKGPYGLVDAFPQQPKIHVANVIRDPKVGKVEYEIINYDFLNRENIRIFKEERREGVEYQTKGIAYEEDSGMF